MQHSVSSRFTCVSSNIKISQPIKLHSEESKSGGRGARIQDIKLNSDVYASSLQAGSTIKWTYTLTSIKQMKWKALRKNSLHGKTAASVLLKLFIRGKTNLIFIEICSLNMYHSSVIIRDLMTKT